MSRIVVGCGCVVKLIGTSPCTDLSVPLPSFCRFGKAWSSSALCWLTWLGRPVVCVGWNFVISFTLPAQSLLLCLWYRAEPASSTATANMPVSFTPVRRWVVGVLCCRGVVRDTPRLLHFGWPVVFPCVCNVDPQWSLSLRHSVGLSLSHWLIVGSSALCCVSSPSRVVVMLIGAGRVVVLLIGTSPSLPLWLASLGCCVRDIEPRWPPVLRHSMGVTLSHLLAVGVVGVVLCRQRRGVKWHRS